MHEIRRPTTVTLLLATAPYLVQRKLSVNELTSHSPLVKQKAEDCPLGLPAGKTLEEQAMASTGKQIKSHLQHEEKEPSSKAVRHEGLRSALELRFPPSRTDSMQQCSLGPHEKQELPSAIPSQRIKGLLLQVPAPRCLPCFCLLFSSVSSRGCCVRTELACHSSE